jgi:hypothetical protein
MKHLNTIKATPLGANTMFLQICKENQVKTYEKYCFRFIYLFETVRIRIHIKQSDPDQIENQDMDRYQSEKQDLDPYQKGLDPQHWTEPLALTALLPENVPVCPPPPLVWSGGYFLAILWQHVTKIKSKCMKNCEQ